MYKFLLHILLALILILVLPLLLAHPGTSYFPFPHRVCLPFTASVLNLALGAATFRHGGQRWSAPEDGRSRRDGGGEGKGGEEEGEVEEAAREGYCGNPQD